MRIFRSNQAKKLVLAFLMASLFYATLGAIFSPRLKMTVKAQGPTKLNVYPSDPITRDPGGLSFILYVNVTDVSDLYTWGFTLRWGLNLLQCSAVTLVTPPSGTVAWDQPISSTTYSDHVDVGSTLTGQVPGKSGWGRLVRFTFKCIGSGNSTLAIENDQLYNTTGLIDHTVTNGYFYTNVPLAKFTFSPNPLDDPKYDGRPMVNETVTFDASKSYDPDQSFNGQTGSGIVDYTWDFGDFNITDALSNPVVTHSYPVNGTYYVNLTVTDDEGLQDWVVYPDAGLRVQYHSIAVINATVNNEPPVVQVGGRVYINVTAVNLGSEVEYMNVTAYAQWYPPNPDNVWHQVNNTVFQYYVWDEFTKTWKPHFNLNPSSNGTATISWDTTGFHPGNYTIRVAISIVKKEGNYWLSYADLESDKSDNQMTAGQVTITGTEVTIHNLAVSSAAISPTNLKLGDWTYANVVIRNKSNVDEHFNATVTVKYPNSTVLKAWSFTNMTVGVGQTKSLGEPLPLDLMKGSTTTQEGSYRLIVTVLIVNPINLTEIPDEYPTDNTFNKLFQIQMIPVAQFTYSPQIPFTGQTVTFNASGSYAPGTNGTIAKYAWTFGDGASFEGSSSIATHVYEHVGAFTVTLKVTDDVGLTDEFSLSPPLSVQILHNIAVTDVALSKRTVTVGGLVTINVTVKNLGYSEETFNVTVFYGLNKITSKLNQVLAAGSNTTLPFAWSTNGVAIGNYLIKAQVSTVPGETITSDNVLAGGTVMIEGVASTITIGAFPTSLKVDESTIVNGSLVPVKVGANVTIWFKLDGEDWTMLSSVNTTADGKYSYTWKPDKAGPYVLYSSWAGDDFTQPGQSEMLFVTVNEAPAGPLNIFLLSTVGLAIVWLATLVYFLVLRKPKAT
jgi:hypothetical protein